MNAGRRRRLGFGHRRGRRTAVGVLLASTVLFGMASAPAAADPPAEGTGPYVALGDSYSSGEGVPPFADGTDEPDNLCHRSLAAYPHLVGDLSDEVPDELVFAACSGAAIPNFYSPGSDIAPDEPAQLDAVTANPDASLVTLGIGGNDIGFVPILTECLRVDTTIGTPIQVNPDYSEEGCDTQLTETGPRKVAELLTGLTGPDGELLDCGGAACSLPQLLDDIAAGAPDARIVVVGYPQILPAEPMGDCSGAVTDEDGQELPFEWRLTEQFLPDAVELFNQLNAQLEAAATAAGATYVDTTPGFAGHEVCSDDPWFNGLILDGVEVSRLSFHPTGEGQAEDARALAAALADQQAPPGPVDPCAGGPRAYPFEDLDGEEPAVVDAITCLFGLDITSGTSATTYGPAESVTRRQMALFIKRQVDAVVALHDGSGPAPTPLPPSDGTTGFADVDDTEGPAFVAAIDQLAEAGIVQGTTSGDFDPGGQVTREQMAAFLANSIEHVTGTTLPAGGDEFPDDGDRLAGFQEAINSLAAVGIAQGDAEGNYRPGEDVSRRQIASFLLRSLTLALNPQG